MSTLSKVLVSLQFISLGYLIIFSNIIGEGFWLFPQLVGGFLSFWAVLIMKPGRFNIQPEVKKNATFITSGPYSLIRNPMYAGIILFFGSSSIHDQKLSTLLAYSLLIIVLIAKIHLEETQLKNRFGAKYLKYKKETYRLIPYLY